MQKLIFGITLFLFLNIAGATTDEQMTAEILTYVNQYRAQHGLPKLAMNPIMVREATHHSSDMARHVLPFGHNGFSTRMHNMHAHIPTSTSGAENVAYNYKTARIVVDGWMKSPGHRQNILGHYNTTGIGIARDNQGRIYYTQLFLQISQHVAKSTKHSHQNATYQHGHRSRAHALGMGWLSLG